MKRFLFKLILFFAISTCIDYAVGITAEMLQNNSKGGTTYKDKFLMDSMSSDVVVMGSSRANHHYNVRLMEDSLGIPVYNAGMDGKGIILNYGLLLEFLNRYKPTLIIYELTPSFDWVKGDNEKYLPHLRLAYDKPGIDSIFWEVNSTEKYKMLSHSYRTNSLVPHLIFDNLFAKADKYNGYVPLHGVHDETKAKDIPEETICNMTVDPLKEKYLINFITLCKNNNIELIFAISPTLSYDHNYYRYGIALSKKYDIPLLNINTTATFNNPYLFQDRSHLNDNGAKRYTEWVISQLKTIRAKIYNS